MSCHAVLMSWCTLSSCSPTGSHGVGLRPGLHTSPHTLLSLPLTPVARHPDVARMRAAGVGRGQQWWPGRCWWPHMGWCRCRGPEPSGVPGPDSPGRHSIWAVCNREFAQQLLLVALCSIPVAGLGSNPCPFPSGFQRGRTGLQAQLPCGSQCHPTILPLLLMPCFPPQGASSGAAGGSGPGKGAPHQQQQAVADAEGDDNELGEEYEEGKRVRAVDCRWLQRWAERVGGREGGPDHAASIAESAAMVRGGGGYTSYAAAVHSIQCLLCLDRMFSRFRRCAVTAGNRCAVLQR